jgi:uncharacterized protein (TIGR03083 family)
MKTFGENVILVPVRASRVADAASSNSLTGARNTSARFHVLGTPRSLGDKSDDVRGHLCKARGMGWQVLGAEPIDVSNVLAAERAELIELLSGLAESSWYVATECPGWRVREVVAHVLHDDLRLLAHVRDGYPGVWFDGPVDQLGAYLDERNGAFVDGTLDLSPRLLIDLLTWCGRELGATYAARDPHSLDDGVAWAIPDGPAPNWLGTAREYTERLAHQNQVRRAVGTVELELERWLGPALDIWRWCLPVGLVGHTGTVEVSVTGAVTRCWLLSDGRFVDSCGSPDASIAVDAAVLARLWTDAPGVDLHGSGDARLITAVRTSRAIIVSR